MTNPNDIFFSLCDTIATLRSEKGCPWDKKQTITSLKKYLREECDELLEAMDQDDPGHLCEELGDILFLVTLIAEIASETGSFTINDVILGIHSKMIRRHPHVFGDMVVETEDDLKKLWEKIKMEEKDQKTN